MIKHKKFLDLLLILTMSSIQSLAAMQLANQEMHKHFLFLQHGYNAIKPYATANNAFATLTTAGFALGLLMKPRPHTFFLEVALATGWLCYTTKRLLNKANNYDNSNAQSEDDTQSHIKQPASSIGTCVLTFFLGIPSAVAMGVLARRIGNVIERIVEGPRIQYTLPDGYF